MWYLWYGWGGLVYLTACAFTKSGAEGLEIVCNNAKRAPHWYGLATYWCIMLAIGAALALCWPILLPFKIWYVVRGQAAQPLLTPTYRTPPMTGVRRTEAILKKITQPTGAGPQVGQAMYAYPTNACRVCSYPYPTEGPLAGVCTKCGAYHCGHCTATAQVTESYMAKCDTCGRRKCAACDATCTLAAADIARLVAPGSTVLCTIPCPHGPDCVRTATVYKNPQAHQGWHRVLCPAGHWGDLGPNSTLLPPEHRQPQG